MSDEWAKTKLDYEQTLATYRQLAEIRFKLLAFVPATSGAAIALLTRTNLGRQEKAAVAVLGFVVTLGIVLYDQRNTQFHNGAVGRAQHLESLMNLRRFGNDREAGLFGSRGDHEQQRLFGLGVGHDLGLALVYSPILGAWAFAAVRGGWPTHANAAAYVGLIVAALALVQFEWHDYKPKRLKCWWKRKTTGEDCAD